jgi:hypothetical protein
MRKIDKVLGLGFLVTLLALSCRKVDVPTIYNTIDLGIVSTATSINFLANLMSPLWFTPASAMIITLLIVK